MLLLKQACGVLALPGCLLHGRPCVLDCPAESGSLGRGAMHLKGLSWFCAVSVLVSSPAGAASATAATAADAAGRAMLEPDLLLLPKLRLPKLPSRPATPLTLLRSSFGEAAREGCAVMGPRGVHRRTRRRRPLRAFSCSYLRACSIYT